MASIFASCCQVDRKASELKKELADWWSETGREMLFSFLEEPEIDEDAGADEEEEDLVDADGQAACFLISRF